MSKIVGSPKRGKIYRVASAAKDRGRSAVRNFEASRKKSARREVPPALMMSKREVANLIDGEARKALKMSGVEFRAAVKRGDTLPDTPAVAQLRLISGANRH